MNHQHKDCPEKENPTLTLKCRNCQLAERERAHLSNYRGCRHAEEEMRRRKSEKTTNTMTGRKFSSKFTTSTISFAAALRGNSEHKKRINLYQDSVVGLISLETSKNEQ
jgi:hypothetical protein